METVGQHTVHLFMINNHLVFWHVGPKLSFFKMSLDLVIKLLATQKIYFKNQKVSFANPTAEQLKMDLH